LKTCKTSGELSFLVVAHRKILRSYNSIFMWTDIDNTFWDLWRRVARNFKRRGKQHRSFNISLAPQPCWSFRCPGRLFVLET